MTEQELNNALEGARIDKVKVNSHREWLKFECTDRNEFPIDVTITNGRAEPEVKVRDRE